MTKFCESIHVERPPDAVWSVVGDLGSIASWLPFLTESRLDGNTRHCQAGENGALRELIVARDDAAHRYEYTIQDAPMPIDFIHAAMSVDADGSGSRVTWATTVMPAELVDMFRPIYVEGLANLKAQLER